MQKYLLKICLLSYLLLFSLSSAEGEFVWLEDLKDKNLPRTPVVIINPFGGYIVFWDEIFKNQEFAQFHYYYYRIVNAKGEIVITKKEIQDWYIPPDNFRHDNVRFNSKNMLWLDSDKLLVIAWRMMLHNWQFERLIIDAVGQIINSDTLRMNEGVGPDAVMVSDGDGNVYAVDYKYAYGPRIVQVYPDFSQAKSMSREEYGNFLVKYPAHTFRFLDCAVAITAEDKILLCGRLGWGPHLKEGAWGTYRPDRVFYCLVDLEGNFVVEPIQLFTPKDAFRKIPGAHLGGVYYTMGKNEPEVASEDLDLTQLPSGDIILSATGLTENNKLCVYQFKFTSEGKFIKPSETRKVKPQTPPKGLVLSVSKIFGVRTWFGGKSYKDEIVLYGFDEEGNFYSEREVWSEVKK